MKTAGSMAEKAAPVAKSGAEKVLEKVAEKRRALGRGLESLLPGPRAVPASTMVAPSEAARTVAPPVATAALAAESATVLSAEAGRARIAVAPPAGVDPGAGARVANGTGEVSAAAVEGTPSSAMVEVLREGVSDRLDGEEVVRLEIHLIDNNPHQTRRKFKEAPLKELADSIRTQGVLQPIVVRASESGRYTLILGERRLRASILAGLEKIPAIVKRVSEQQAAEMTLVENLQRQDLNCLEQADAFANLSQKFHLTQEEIGARVGVSRETVANYMRLLTLPEAVQIELLRGTLTYSHARALLQLNPSSPEAIWSYAKKVLDEKLSVAVLEELVTGASALRKASQPGGARWVDPNVKAAQRELEEVLGMRVRIRDRNGRGKIVIEYNRLEDFDRVVRMLKGK